MFDELAKEAKWFRLDNAAKIYPVVASAKNSGIYRMGIIMKEKVDPIALQEAVVECRERFPTFFVRLRRGLFWYYFEQNDKDPIVWPESPFICQSIDIHTNNHYMFTFLFYENRISLEVFHGIADGSGSFEFMKTVLYLYLNKIGYPQINDGSVFKLEDRPSLAELEDSYIGHFRKTKMGKNPFIRAYRITGKRFKRRGINLTVGKMETSQLQKLASEHNVAFTEFLVGLMIYSILKNGNPKKLIKKPVALTIPVNMRKYFRSQSVRNFSLFFKVSYQMGKTMPTFAEILESVKEQFVSERSVEKLQNLLDLNVMFEKNILIKLTPLFIKKLIFKIGYAILGDLPITTSISNFGIITLPETMTPHVDSFEFNLASGRKPGMAIASFSGKTTIAMNRCVADSSIEETYFSYLGQHGIDLDIHSNYWQ